MRINLKAKIIIPLSLVFLIIIFSFLYTYNSIKNGVIRIYEIKSNLDYIKISVNEIYSNAQSGILTGNPAYSVKMAQKSLEVQDMIYKLEKYETSIKNQENDFLNDISNINKLYLDTYAKIVSVNSLFLENRIEEGRNRLKEIEEGYGQIISAIDLIVNKNEQRQAEVMKRINILFAASAGIFFLMFIAIAFVILPIIIIKPISIIKSDIGQIADGEGDLTRKVNASSNDEIGDLCKEFNRFIDSQAEMIKQIIEKSKLLSESSDNLEKLSNHVDNTACEVEKAIEEIAESATEQAKDTENGVGKMILLGDIISKCKEKMHNLTKQSQHVEKLKNEGLDIVEELISNVAKNTHASENVREVALDTVQSVEKIKQRVQMIQDIASQTNMLALNASIESVKAGEAGKGFSVVASEIRKLAEQSNKFAKDIIWVIQEVVQKTNVTVDTVEKLRETVVKQEESAKETNAIFEGIACSSEKMQDIIMELDRSFEEVFSYKDEMIKIMHNLSAISQQNAAATQQAAASVQEQSAFIKNIAETSEQTANIANQLDNIAARFKL